MPRAHRCGKCAGCTQDDCGACTYCLDKKSFGGAGKLKRACVESKCIVGKDDQEKQRVKAGSKRGRHKDASTGASNACGKGTEPKRARRKRVTPN